MNLLKYHPVSGGVCYVNPGQVVCMDVAEPSGHTRIVLSSGRTVIVARLLADVVDEISSYLMTDGQGGVLRDAYWPRGWDELPAPPRTIVGGAER